MRPPWEPQPRPTWAGVAVRYPDGSLLTVQMAPVYDGSVDIERGDYDDIHALGLAEPRHRLYVARPELRIELRGVLVDDAHWTRWAGTPAPTGDLPGGDPMHRPDA